MTRRTALHPGPFDHAGADDPSSGCRRTNQDAAAGDCDRTTAAFAPLRIEEEVATLDVLSKGRVEFDIGRMLRQYRRYRIDLGEQFISNKFVLPLDLPWPVPTGGEVRESINRPFCPRFLKRLARL